MASEQAVYDERRLLAFALKYPAQAAKLDIEAADFNLGSHAPLYSVWVEGYANGVVDGPESLSRFVTENRAEDYGLVAAAGSLSTWLDTVVVGPESGQAALAPVRLRRRKLAAWNAAKAFQDALKDPFTDVAEPASKLKAELDALNPRSVSTMSDDVAGILAIETEAIECGKQLMVPTGLKEMDKKWGGLSNEGVTLIIGVSGHGKTTLVNRLYFGMCAGGFGCYVHGTETTKEQRLRNIIYSSAGINQIAARQAGNPGEVVRRLKDAADMVGAFKGEVTGSGLYLSQICHNIRAGREAGRVEAAFVDYLQDIPKRTEESRIPQTEWVMRCSQAFKDLSAELQIPIILGAQAMKPNYFDAVKNPRPGMWSCQWGSKPTQDAEEVFALYYNDAYRAEWGDSWPVVALPKHIEVWKRKARRSELGGVEIAFDGPTTWLGEPALF